MKPLGAGVFVFEIERTLPMQDQYSGLADLSVIALVSSATMSLDNPGQTMGLLVMSRIHAPTGQPGPAPALIEVRYEHIAVFATETRNCQHPHPLTVVNYLHCSQRTTLEYEVCGLWRRLC